MGEGGRKGVLRWCDQERNVGAVSHREGSWDRSPPALKCQQVAESGKIDDNNPWSNCSGRRHRVITREQALACGMTDRMLRYRIRAGGPWRKLLPGVYVTVTGIVSTQQREMAALLHAGPRSVLTGLAAARRHGIRTLTSSTATYWCHQRPVPRALASSGCGALGACRRSCVDGEIRYVLAGRAVADAARSLTGARDVRGLVAQAIQQQRCSIATLTSELEEGAARGSALLRCALGEVADGIRSVAEGDLRILLKRGRVLEAPVQRAPVRQRRHPDRGGGRLVGGRGGGS